MRVLKEIQHPACKISIFAWNQKFLLKFDQGMCEQTFKFNQLDVPELDDVLQIMTDDFMAKVISRFDEMHGSLQGALEGAR